MTKFTDQIQPRSNRPRHTGNALQQTLHDITNALPHHVDALLNTIMSHAQEQRLDGYRPMLKDLCTKALDEALKDPLPFSHRALQEKFATSQQFVAHIVEDLLLTEVQKKDIKDIYSCLTKTLQFKLQRSVLEGSASYSGKMQ